jgi:hypothetical protein
LFDIEKWQRHRMRKKEADRREKAVPMNAAAENRRVL